MEQVIRIFITSRRAQRFIFAFCCEEFFSQTIFASLHTLKVIIEAKERCMENVTIKNCQTLFEERKKVKIHSKRDEIVSEN